MVSTWVVRLEVARDDDGGLSDEGLADLTKLLSAHDVQPVVTRGDSGTVLVHMTLDARNDRAAGSAAELMLRESAQTVWSALGLPPFTIRIVDVTQGAR
jgi:hypothetical protein